jgi:hypothetical protein
MNWQLFAVTACVAAAAIYLARQSWRTWAGKGKACGGGCHCGDTAKSPDDATHANLIPVEQLTLRRGPR